VGATVATSALMGLSAAGAASSSSANTPAPPPLNLPSSLKGSAPSSVKIGLAGGYAVNFLPTLIAKGAGYFDTVGKRFHTTISFDVYGGGTTGEPAFLGGTDQWVVIGVGSSIPAVVAGKDQISVFNPGVQLSNIFVAAAKYKATRTSMSAFAPPGNTWCQISPVGASNTALTLQAGILNYPLSQLNVTTIGSVAAVLPSVQSGQCQVSTSDPNSAALGIIQGTAYAVATQEDAPSTVPLAGSDIGIPVQTSMAFIQQYPKLSQAIEDAIMKALQYIQANYQNANALYSVLPSDMTATLSLGAFAQTMQLFGVFWNKAYTNGTFTAQQINDTITLLEGVKTIPPGTAVNPSKAFYNKLAIQAWKDLGTPIPTNPAINGPSNVPTSLGKPSQESAKAYTILVPGSTAPANSGPNQIGQIPVPSSGTTTTTAASSTSTTS
jgi:ABC-type nitrate/sulfonate/bicarbonate transport system substrate-binding protein